MLVALIAILVIATPAVAIEVKCEIASKYACSRSGCQENQITVWNIIDAQAGRFSRCDRKGCDHLEAGFSESGIYVNIWMPKKAMFAKLSLDGSDYVEVVSLGTNVLVSYGECKRMRNE
jgi:hypothetical protein